MTRAACLLSVLLFVPASVGAKPPVTSFPDLMGRQIIKEGDDLAVVDGLGALAATATCESLSSLRLPGTRITMAQTVAPSALILPRRSRPDAWTDLPAFCRVAATLEPSGDSNITIEVWLPSEGWNGRYQAVGNGGWAGVISYGRMAEALTTRRVSRVSIQPEVFAPVGRSRLPTTICPRFPAPKRLSKRGGVSWQNS